MKLHYYAMSAFLTFFSLRFAEITVGSSQARCILQRRQDEARRKYRKILEEKPAGPQYQGELYLDQPGNQVRSVI